MNKTEHCCERMEHFLKENKIAIGYSTRFRSYYINLKGVSMATQRITYCPWCSSRLPNTLHDAYDKELSKTLRIKPEDITLDHYYGKDLPKEFKTDEWWIKRGL